ncbi:phosphotransferase [Sporosarcina sp. ANT_H38]|uniref:phosphotransferase n=1 Tax=Sporosarcina sp. ANT_H38 TaxID=2597358 RepID=UPI0011F140AB|nr:phosphotransferase [Sporosarcina sp. ANT_H38]KAA0965718.1 phosphotransferase [Sporosarcina sp. ANT_H38]
MTGIHILQKFGFYAKEEPASIYPFSPVYRVNDAIIKKTQHPMERARRLMTYTTFLKENSVLIVTPALATSNNPQTIGDDTYVVYPFIEGATYSGTETEIIAAGELLGKIHALSPTRNTFDLKEYDVFDFNKDEVTESVEKIAKNAASHHFEMDELQLKEKLLQIVSQQDELKSSGMTSVATPHDFKANNLIYTPEPYLIDPDNAAWVPRIFDLALALLLFHNELTTAPDVPFTPARWQLFIQGYTKSVTFTDVEYAYWQYAVEHVFLDEVMWLMADVEEDWENTSQRILFGGLLKILFDTSSYGLG